MLKDYYGFLFDFIVQVWYRDFMNDYRCLYMNVKQIKQASSNGLLSAKHTQDKQNKQDKQDTRARLLVDNRLIKQDRQLVDNRLTLQGRQLVDNRLIKNKRKNKNSWTIIKKD